MNWIYEREVSMNLAIPSLRADSTDSLKRSEVPPPVESAHQRRKACLRSRGVPRVEEPNLIGRERFHCCLAIQDSATETSSRTAFQL